MAFKYRLCSLFCSYEIQTFVFRFTLPLPTHLGFELKIYLFMNGSSYVT